MQLQNNFQDVYADRIHGWTSIPISEIDQFEYPRVAATTRSSNKKQQQMDRFEVEKYLRNKGMTLFVVSVIC